MAANGVGEQLRARVHRSPLSRWLRQHHAEIAEVFAAQGRPAWEALAATARANGVLDKYGKPPNRGAVRTAWLKLEQNINKKATNRLSEIPASIPASESVPLSAPAGPVAAIPSPPAARPRHTFAVARFKSKE